MTTPNPLPAQTEWWYGAAPSTVPANLPGEIIDAIANVRRVEQLLEQNEASEFSGGKGTEPPGLRVTLPYRHALPVDGGRYRGKVPQREGIPIGFVPNPHGSAELGRCLRQYG